MEDGLAVPAGDLEDGPGRVSRYLRIGLVHNGADLVNGDIRILSEGFRPANLAVTPRIGISRARDLPLRFVATEFHDD